VGYNYQDGEGKHVGHGPSIGGACHMISVLEKYAGKKVYPNLHSFVETGESSSPELIKAEAERLMAKVSDQKVYDTLSRLARAAAQAKGKLVVTH